MSDGVKRRRPSRCTRRTAFMKTPSNLTRSALSCIQVWARPTCIQVSRATDLSTTQIPVGLVPKRISGGRSTALLLESPVQRRSRELSVSITGWPITVPIERHPWTSHSTASKDSKVVRQPRDSTPSSPYTDRKATER